MNLVKKTGLSVNLDHIEHAEFIPAHRADLGDGDFLDYRDTLKLVHSDGGFWNPDGEEAYVLRDFLERHCIPPLKEEMDDSELSKKTTMTMSLRFVKIGHIYVNLGHVTSFIFYPSRLEKERKRHKDEKKGKKGKKKKKSKGELRLIPDCLCLFKANHSSWDVWGERAAEVRDYLEENFVVLRTEK